MHASSAMFSIGCTMAGIVTLKLPPVLHAINYFSPFKYMVANVAVYSLRGRVFTCVPGQEVGKRCPISSGEDVLQLYNLDVDPTWNLVVLAVLAVFYRLVACFVVKASRMEWKWSGNGDWVRKPSFKLGVQSGRGWCNCMSGILLWSK